MPPINYPIPALLSQDLLEKWQKITETGIAYWAENHLKFKLQNIRIQRVLKEILHENFHIIHSIHKLHK